MKKTCTYTTITRKSTQCLKVNEGKGLEWKKDVGRNVGLLIMSSSKEGVKHEFLPLNKSER